LLIAAFILAGAVSLGTSLILVSRVERLGARLGCSEALLGLLAALAADAPEITAAVSATSGHHSKIGAGVVLGSNVFNLAALLGLSAIAARRIALHRRVIVLEGLVAVPVAGAAVAVVTGALAPWVGLVAVAAIVGAYAVVVGLPRDRLDRLGLPAAWARWLHQTISEDELELAEAIHPQPGGRADAGVAALAVLVVVGASVAMEQAASKFGSRHGIAEVVVGALILAVVTTIPNLVAAVYLALRGRGAATLSTAMNSNALNVLAGLMIPGAIIGVATSSGLVTLVAGWYAGLTALALVTAYLARGLSRAHGVIIACAYLAFASVLVATA
jgi:cation:H+ antiporter